MQTPSAAFRQKVAFEGPLPMALGACGNPCLRTAPARIYWRTRHRQRLCLEIRKQMAMITFTHAADRVCVQPYIRTVQA
ncbi:MAG: hypothetical protein JWO52_4269 [Gammaproteobacteria bacterium]|jgi:hypothetical protein|nr:hypothetical protein [Gammaproteobacteria bacterium]